MKTTSLKKLLFGNMLILMSLLTNGQHGLENIIVEKYYVSDANDEINSIGILPVGSVTYRIFVDMLPGYKFKKAYGSPNHPLTIKTTTSFFNNEDKGNTHPMYTKIQACGNTVMLDSWLSAGAACYGNFGILKSKDDSVETVINYDGILKNADTSAGIPLTVQDGLIAGSPDTFNIIGINSEIAVFGNVSQAGYIFTTSNGAWFCPEGAVGPTSDNQVLIAQITTDGIMSFELNIQIKTPAGDTQNYVAKKPQGNEILLNSLKYNWPTDLEINSVDKPEILIYPNPAKDIFSINLERVQNNTGYSYAIYDITGNLIMKKTVEKTQGKCIERINLASFPNGVYFIEVSLNDVRSTSKLIKN